MFSMRESRANASHDVIDKSKRRESVNKFYYKKKTNYLKDNRRQG